MKFLRHRPFKLGSLNAFFWSLWWFAYCFKLPCFVSPPAGMAPMRGIELLRTNWCGRKLDFCLTKLLPGLFCGIYMEKEMSLLTFLILCMLLHFQNISRNLFSNHMFFFFLSNIISYGKGFHLCGLSLFT